MNRLMAYRITLHIFLMFQFFSIAVDSFADSIDDSGKIKGLNQGDVEKGNEHGKLGSYMEAIKDYDKAVELNPQDSRAYYNRSLMYAELGKYQQASEVSASLLLLKNSRVNELQADNEGVNIMHLAGYDPRAMIDIQTMLLKLSNGKNPPAIISTHPPSQERVDAIRKAIVKVK